MPDATTTTTAAPAAPATTTTPAPAPAVATPAAPAEAAPPAPAERLTFDRVRDAIESGELEKLETPVTAPAPAETAAPSTEKPADGGLSEAELQQFVRESRERRDEKKAAREIETLRPAADSWSKAAELVKQGKHLEAIKALGADIHAAAREAMGVETEPDPTAKIREENERLKREVAEREQREKAAAESARMVDSLVTDVGKDERFADIAKDKAAVVAAVREANDVYTEFRRRSGRDLTDAEKDRLVVSALMVHQEDLRKRTTQQAPAPKPADKPPAPASTPQRAAATTTPRQKISFEEKRKQLLGN